MTTSNRAYCEVQLHKREKQTTPQHRSSDSINRVKEWVLRSLSPETLQSMPCWVFTTSCVSLLLEIGHLSNHTKHSPECKDLFLESSDADK